MFATAEVRWFIPGPAPDDARRWFDALGPALDSASRTDRYLHPSSDGLGLKLRGGGDPLLEPKRRAAGLGAVRPHARVAGHAERWHKWSFRLAEDAVPEGAWIEVAKTRRLCILRVGADGVAPVRAFPEAGPVAAVELGTVRAAGKPAWWTVCAEASGADEADLPGVLRESLAWAFGRGAPPPLRLADSMGYAAWLRRLTGTPSDG